MMRGSVRAHDVERRVLAAYVGAFALVLAVAAVLVFFTFAFTLRQQAIDRLDALGRNALDEISVRKHHRIAIEHDPSDLTDPSRLLARREAVEWIADGEVIGTAGIALPPAPPHAEQVTVGREAFLVRRIEGRAHGILVAARVAESGEITAAPLRVLAAGLAAGWVAATLGAAVLGGLFGRRVFARVEDVARRQTEFVADASHELRGPLTVIATNASALMRGAPVDERTRRGLENVLDASNQIERLTNRLLFLARIEGQPPGSRDLVDLDQCLTAIAHAYRDRAHERGLRLEGPRGEAGGILGAQDDVRRIVENLVENALAYTPAGGVISIQAHRERGRAVVAVRDTGIGIARSDLERIFDRFWRADSARSHDGASSGLGLSIVRRLLARNDASIDVESVPGKGSTFTVRFTEAPGGGAAGPSRIAENL